VNTGAINKRPILSQFVFYDNNIHDSLLMLVIKTVKSFKIKATASTCQGILTEGRGLSTIDLLIKLACFVKKENNIFNIKGADLNYLEQVGQLYFSSPFNKSFLNISENVSF